jgi:flavodoxin I
MISIGIFYGSTNGDSARAAAEICRLCEDDPALQGWARCETVDIAEYELAEMLDFDLILLGTPTWNVGQLQKDWQAVFDEFDALDLSGKTVALFGMGDQVGYPDTFVDAIFFVADKAMERGARLIGRTSPAGYAFTGSWALVDGVFLGLPLDEINQPELTEPRLRAWLAQVRREYSEPDAQ